MMVDFVGLPGCGKSFMTEKLQQRLSEKGFVVHNLSRNRKTSIACKILFKLAALFLYVSPYYYRKKKMILEKIGDAETIPYESNFFIKEKKKIVKDLILNSFVHNAFDSPKKIFLNDEGIVHKVLYMTIFFKIPLNSMMEIFEILRTKPLTFFIKCSVEQSFASIKERNRKDCPMDFLNNDELLFFLNSFLKKINLMQKMICLPEIDRDNDLEQKLAMVCEVVTGNK